jgi:quinol monooxygenase YgiN
MLAFEIYATRADLYDTHLTSPAMQTFLEKIPSASTTGLDLNHYQCTAGFLDASGNKEEAGVMQDIRINCVSAEALAALLPALKNLVDVVDASGGTLTYMAFRGLDDDVSARIYGRWKTRGDMEAFIRRADVNGFWMANKEHVRVMEQRLYVPNGKGWLHRGSGYAGEKKGVKAKI